MALGERPAGLPSFRQEDMLAPRLGDGVQGFSSAADQPPGRDMPGGFEGKVRSGGIKSSTPETELLQTESNPRVARALGGSSSLRAPTFLWKEFRGHGSHSSLRF